MIGFELPKRKVMLGISSIAWNFVGSPIVSPSGHTAVNRKPMRLKFNRAVVIFFNPTFLVTILRFNLE